MNESSLEFATIEELAPLLAKKKVSPVELAELFLLRIYALNPALNAYLTVTGERALEEARVAERELMCGKRRGPLHGIPIALKDNIWTRGVRTTAGSLIMRRFRAGGGCYSHPEAAHSRRAVLLGKTNMHEFAYGITSENPHYGPTHNPWNLERVTGGWSGGSAAAIAAGLCVASVGTDTGGSIRVPAALCGIVGLKPTFGRVSRYGVVPLALSFDHVGPLARSAVDVALVLNAIAGLDSRDSASAAIRRDDFARGSLRKLKRVRIGWPREYFWTSVDPQVYRLAEAAVKDLVKAGARVEEVSLPTLPATAEASNTMALVEATAFHEAMNYFPACAQEYGEDVRERLTAGGKVLGVDYLLAREVIRRSRSEFRSALERVDVIAAPAAAIAAPRIGSERTRVGDGRSRCVRR